MKVRNSLHELTLNLYLRYKKQGFSDVQIQRLYNSGPNTFTRWKKAHNIPMGLNIKTFEAQELFFPAEIERLKKEYIAHEKKGWTIQQIGDALKMSEKQIMRFRARYFPKKVLKYRRRFTEEEMEMAKKAGVRMRTVTVRLSAGWPLEKALTMPKGYNQDGESRSEIMKRLHREGKV